MRELGAADVVIDGLCRVTWLTDVSPSAAAPVRPSRRALPKRPYSLFNMETGKEEAHEAYRFDDPPAEDVLDPPPAAPEPHMDSDDSREAAWHNARPIPVRGT